MKFLSAIRSFISPELNKARQYMFLSLDNELEKQIFQEIEAQIKIAKRSNRSVINSIVNKHIPKTKLESILIDSDIISDWNRTAPIEKLIGLLKQNGHVLISENPLEIKIE